MKFKKTALYRALVNRIIWDFYSFFFVITFLTIINIIIITIIIIIISLQKHCMKCSVQRKPV